jgi:lipoprotein LprA
MNLREANSKRLHRLGTGSVALLIVMFAAGIPAFGGVSAQDEDDEARALLEEAAQTMAEVPSFHFELVTEGGVTTILEEFEIEAVEGNVQRPDRFQATVTAALGGFVRLDVHVVGIGDRVWLTDPMSNEGRLIEISVSGTEGEPLIDLLNPDRLLLQAVELVEEPKIAGTEEIDGVETTKIEGTFDPSGFDVGTPAPVMLNLDPKPVTIWIDDEGRVIQLQVEGPLTEAEDADIVRTLRLSDFGAEIEITPPAGG